MKKVSPRGNKAPRSVHGTGGTLYAISVQTCEGRWALSPHTGFICITSHPLITYMECGNDTRWCRAVMERVLSRRKLESCPSSIDSELLNTCLTCCMRARPSQWADSKVTCNSAIIYSSLHYTTMNFIPYDITVL